MDIYNFIGDNAPNYKITMLGKDRLTQTSANKALFFQDVGAISNMSSPVYHNNKAFIAAIWNADKRVYLLEYDKTIKDIPDRQYKLLSVWETEQGGFTEVSYAYQTDSIELLRLQDGEFLIFINDSPGVWEAGATNKAKISVLSTRDLYDVEVKSRITKANNKEIKEDKAVKGFSISRPVVTQNGEIYISVQDKGYMYDGEVRPIFKVLVSRDKGSTWNELYSETSFGSSYIKHSSDLVKYGDNLIFSITSAFNNTTRILSLNTKTKDIKEITSYDNTSVGYGAIFQRYDDKLVIYDRLEDKLYETVLRKDLNITFDTTNWSDISGELDEYDDESQPMRLYPSESGFLLKHGDLSNIYIDEYALGEYTLNRDVTSVSVDKSYDMITNATISLSNKDGKYAPDGFANRYLLWVNKKVEIRLGYGEDLDLVFTGYIDDVDMSTFPQEITISCRDSFKLARDQLFYWKGQYNRTFKNASADYIWKEAAKTAGLEIGTVERSGIVFKEREYVHVEVYDILEDMAELAGFQNYCDEKGVCHFIRERQLGDWQKEDLLLEIYHEFEAGEIENGFSVYISIPNTDLLFNVVARPLGTGLQAFGQIVNDMGETQAYWKDSSGSHKRFRVGLDMGVGGDSGVLLKGSANRAAGSIKVNLRLKPDGTSNASIVVDTDRESYSKMFDSTSQKAEVRSSVDNTLFFKYIYGEESDVSKVFKEGKNITSLTYRVDDRDLYRKVIVLGMVGDKQHKYEADFGAANVYNLLPNKAIIIDAQEVPEREELKVIADAQLRLMRTRGRHLEFTAIADTKIKVGDYVRVIESSTTVSEVYRVTNLGFHMDSGGYTMTVGSHHV